jgi:hypothetical protein
MDTKQIVETLTAYKNDLDFVNVVPTQHINLSSFNNNSKVLEHAAWMIQETLDMLKVDKVDEEQVIHWFGFIRGALWSIGFGKR